MQKARNVLLIGSTGFIGKVTLGMLLERSDVDKVYILLRPKINPSEKKKRESMDTSTVHINEEMIDNNFNAVMKRFKQLKMNPCLQSDACQKAFSDGRVIPVAGNLALKDLGLSVDDYQRMTSGRSPASNDDSSTSTSISFASLLGFRSSSVSQWP